MSALLLVSPAGAQSFPEGIDERGVHLINRQEGVAFSWVLGTADRTAYPAYYGAIPTAWAATVLSGHSRRDALQMTVSMVGAYGAVVSLKRLVSRPRPIAVHSWIVPRRHYPGGADLDPYSWPSGHATMAAALAASLALQFPEWYVVAPAAAWATAVGFSRMWLGVHYPSDVLTGWVLGTGVALLVHELGNNGKSDSLSESPLFRISLPIG